MKKSLLLIFLGMLTAYACKQDQASSIDVNMLQKNMDADPEVTKLRALLYQHARLLSSIPESDLDAITEKTHTCGIYGSTAPLTDLENCIAGMPSASQYMDFQRAFRQYAAQYKTVEKRFPDLTQLDNKKKAELIAPLNEEEAEKVLSDYLSTIKK